jgi:hypothetical protein
MRHHPRRHSTRAKGAWSPQQDPTWSVLSVVWLVVQRCEEGRTGGTAALACSDMGFQKLEPEMMDLLLSPRKLCI